MIRYKKAQSFFKNSLQTLLGFLLLSFFSQPLLAADNNTITLTSQPTITTPRDNMPSDTPAVTYSDPYEKINRFMFGFNELIDKMILTPVAKVYNTILPNPVIKGISNFFQNIDTIPTVANDVLQANFYQAWRDLWRLGINTTVGMVGFVDIASHIGLAPNTEDFGLTLARWGYVNSNYLVLPFFGPSTTRDTIGLPINYFFFTIYPYIEPPRTRYEIYALGVVSRRAELLRFQDVMQQIAVDKYTFLRDAYLQRRAYLIQRNNHLSFSEQNNS